MSTEPKQKNNRWMVIPLLVPIGLFCAWAVYNNIKLLPSCPLYNMSGVHCPGCGMTRATRAILNFDIIAAIRYNPLYVIFLPYLFWLTVPPFFAWVRKKKCVRKKPKKAIVVAFIVLFVFWFVLRNIPHPSLDWARPTPDTIFTK